MTSLNDYVGPYLHNISVYHVIAGFFISLIITVPNISMFTIHVLIFSNVRLYPFVRKNNSVSQNVFREMTENHCRRVGCFQLLYTSFIYCYYCIMYSKIYSTNVRSVK